MIHEKFKRNFVRSKNIHLVTILSACVNIIELFYVVDYIYNFVEKSNSLPHSLWNHLQRERTHVCVKVEASRIEIRPRWIVGTNSFFTTFYQFQLSTMFHPRWCTFWYSSSLQDVFAFQILIQFLEKELLKSWKISRKK